MKDGLFAELKRRNVFRACIAYVALGWVVTQVTATVQPMLHLPESIGPVVLWIGVIGFPFVVMFSWVYELTPEGLKREGDVDRSASVTHVTGRRLDYATIVLLAAAIGLLAFDRFKPRTARPAPAPAAAVSAPATPAKGAAAAVKEQSVAVLPFENLSTDKNNGYFADGMQDLILTKLADIGDLKVISRTSTLQYGSHPQNLKKIGLELGVATLLEGSVQKAGDAVLINVQLINARTDAHIWAQSYTRTLDNVFGVEGEVAGKIADALKARLSPAEAKRLAVTLSADSAANDLFLRGEYLANRATMNYDTAEMKQAIGFYRQAIAKVANFAQARARLAYVESALAWFGGGGGKVAPLFADAREQAERALELAPDLAEAHLAQGYYDYWGKGDYAAALAAFAAALALRPNDSNTLAAQAYVLRRQARFDDAVDRLQKAMALDPRNSVPAFETGATCMMANRYLQAQKFLQRALALDPANANARRNYGLAILLRNGDFGRALAEMRGDDPQTKMQRARLLLYAHKYSEAISLLQNIPDTPDNFRSNNLGPKSLQLAYLYRLSGDSAKARALYAEALPEARAQYAALAGSPINQGIALAYVASAEIGLDQSTAALADAAKVQAIVEHSNDRSYGPGLMQLCAQLYARTGHASKALRLLSAALAAPGIGFFYSPALLWLDPAWDRIRKDPGFQALQEKYARDRPAVVPDGSGQTAEALTGTS